jgi:hypothetical protein
MEGFSMLTAKDYESAIIVQDACNLSGVVHSFCDIIKRITEESREKGKGTQYVNEHPICKLFADKIADLARVRDFESYYQAFNECERKAG